MNVYCPVENDIAIAVKRWWFPWRRQRRYHCTACGAQLPHRDHLIEPDHDWRADGDRDAAVCSNCGLHATSLQIAQSRYGAQLPSCNPPVSHVEQRSTGYQVERKLDADTPQ